MKGTKTESPATMPHDSEYEGDHVDDSERMTLQDDRRGGNRRKLVRYIPDVSAGTVLQSIGLLLAFAGAYGTYTSDRAEMRKDIEANKTIAAAATQAVSQSVVDLKADTRETRTAVQNVAEKLSEVGAQLKVIQANQDKKR